jgi:hypothetical protein
LQIHARRYILQNFVCIYTGKETSVFELSDFIQAHGNDLLIGKHAGHSKVVQLNISLNDNVFSGLSILKKSHFALETSFYKEAGYYCVVREM